MAAAEAEKRALIERLAKPSGLSEDEKVKLASTVIQRAVRNGLTEVQVYRFPNAMCSDRGRRINNAEPDWPQTLEGLPKAGYEFWRDHLQSLGFGLKAEILEYPGGMPGDIGFFLTWK